MRITGKIRSIGATVALASVMLLSACGGEGGGGGTTTSKSNSDLLKEAAKNMREAQSYTLNADLTAGGQPVKMLADLEGLDKDAKNAKMDMEAAGQKIAIIAIGDKVWASMDGGQTFTDASASGAQMTSSIDELANMWDKLTDDQIDKAKDQLKDGSPATETIDGVNTKHMTGDIKALSALSTSGGGNVSEGTIDIWVSTDSPSRVHQMRIDAKSNDQPIKGTFKWSNFGKDFDINAPPQ